MEKKKVSQRAALARINRTLLKDHDKRLHKCPAGSQYNAELGDYYTVDLSINMIVDKHVDLQDLGEELGVIKKWEAVEED